MQKQLEGTQKYINEQQIELPISATHAIIVSIAITLPAEYKCLKYWKTEQLIYECLLGFCLTLRRHKFWLHRQFSSPNSRNEEMMAMVLVLLLPVCFE